MTDRSPAAVSTMTWHVAEAGTPRCKPQAMPEFHDLNTMGSCHGRRPCRPIYRILIWLWIETPCCRVAPSPPSVTSLCRGRLFQTLCCGFPAAMTNHTTSRYGFVFGGLSRRGLSQNIPRLLTVSMSRNGRPSLLQTLCF